MRRSIRIAAAVVLMTSLAACSPGTASPARSPSSTKVQQPTTAKAPNPPAPAPALRGPFRHPLPGMPAQTAGDVYADAGASHLSARLAHDPAYLYVPNSYGRPVTTVIDQHTHKIVRVLHTGSLSQHVTPSWDLRTLYVEASADNRLVAIDPRTGRVARRIHQERPYNLYFTPNGRRAVVMDEQHDAIAFDDPHTFRRLHVLRDHSCIGPNHADFSANGRFFLVSCEFSGSMLRVSTLGERVTARLQLPAGAKPQDVRLAPDGRTFYVADMGRNKLLRINYRHLEVTGHLDLPAMPHGIYPSRDGRSLYVSDRMAGEVSVVSLRTNTVVATWRVPGGHPDMGGLSADGRTLWLSGRYDGYVYGWNTRTGRLVARIRVGGQPHGLLVWPQPGRYSLGHTGIMR